VSRQRTPPRHRVLKVELTRAANKTGSANGAPRACHHDQPIRRARIAAGTVSQNGDSAAAKPAMAPESAPRIAKPIRSVRNAMTPSANGSR